MINNWGFQNNLDPDREEKMENFFGNEKCLETEPSEVNLMTAEERALAEEKIEKEKNRLRLSLKDKFNKMVVLAEKWADRENQEAAANINFGDLFKKDYQTRDKEEDADNN